MRTVRSLTASTAAVLALILLAAVPAAQAQSRAKTTLIGAFGGYNVASDIYTSYNSSTKLALNNGFEWGGRLTHFTSEYSAVEFAYTRNGSDMEIQNNFNSVIPPGFDAGRLNLDQFDLNFLMSKPTSNPNVWPYFTLGVGWTNTSPEVNAVNPSNQPVKIDGNSLFAFNLGIGTLIDMNPKIGVRLDARWRVTDTNVTTSSGVYCDYWGYCWSYASDWYNSGEFTAGLQYKFGGH
jgi:opacity protein-like surface antigen